MNPFGPGAFYFGRLLIIHSFLKLDMFLFCHFLSCFWFSFYPVFKTSTFVAVVVACLQCRASPSSTLRVSKPGFYFQAQLSRSSNYAEITSLKERCPANFSKEITAGSVLNWKKVRNLESNSFGFKSGSPTQTPCDLTYPVILVIYIFLL